MGSLWNYDKDELTDDTSTNNNPNKYVINSESFKYKTSITGRTYNVDEKIANAEGNDIDNPAYDANKSGKKEVGIAVPLKYLSNFWRTLYMPLIVCEVSLTFTRPERYFSRPYKLIAIDLSNKLISLEDFQEMKDKQCFSSLKSWKKQRLNFHKMLQQLFDFDYV